jgi:hypothetical protein
MQRILIVISVAVACATPLSPAWALWGCKVNYNGGGTIRVWGYDNSGEARAGAMKFCTTGHHRGCRIDDCRSGVDNQDQAYSVWPGGGRTTRCFGTAQC